MLDSVALPIPFNVLVGIFRRLWHNLKGNRVSMSAYDIGYNNGYTQGSRLGSRVAHSQTLTREIRNILDNYDEEFLKVISDRGENKSWKYEFIQGEVKRLEIKRNGE